MHTDKELCESNFLQIERRKKVPDPVEKEKGASLWSMIKDKVGKDLTRVCLPVYFNEPISSLQKCLEDLEYSHLLDRAHEYGKQVLNSVCLLLHATFFFKNYMTNEQGISGDTTHVLSDACLRMLPNLELIQQSWMS